MVASLTPADEEARRQMNGRSEDQILGAMAGHTQSGLVVTLHGETRYIRPLSIKNEKVWKESVSAVAAKASAAITVANIEIDDTQALAAVLASNLDDVLDLVVAFDALGQGALNRDWLEDKVSGIEIRETLEVLLDSVYPPIAGMRPGRILLGVILAGAAAQSLPAASTNDSSPAIRGSTAPKTSKRR